MTPDERRIRKAATQARADLMVIFEECWSDLSGTERDDISRVRNLLADIEDGVCG